METAVRDYSLDATYFSSKRLPLSALTGSYLRRAKVDRWEFFLEETVNRLRLKFVCLYLVLLCIIPLEVLQNFSWHENSSIVLVNGQKLSNDVKL